MDDKTEQAYDAEEKAHRKAIEAYTEVIEQTLGVQLFVLAGTRHQHRSMPVHEETGKAVMITVTVAFSDLLDASEMQEMIDQATRAPGSIPEA